MKYSKTYLKKEEFLKFSRILLFLNKKCLVIRILSEEQNKILN